MHSLLRFTLDKIDKFSKWFRLAAQENNHDNDMMSE